MNVYHETQLAWPEGKLKTPHDRRKNGQFKTTLANALSRVEGAVGGVVVYRDVDHAARGNLNAARCSAAACEKINDHDEPIKMPGKLGLFEWSPR